jgi:hypothetical protein
MRQLFYAVIAATALLGACSVTPKDAPQGAYEATVVFASSLKAANVYAAMPRCSATQKDPCSRQEIVNQIASAARRANEAVRGAQQVAKDTKRTDADRQKAVQAANDAVAALNRVIPTAEVNN